MDGPRQHESALIFLWSVGENTLQPTMKNEPSYNFLLFTSVGSWPYSKGKLDWTRKKVEQERRKKFCIYFLFCTKSRTSDTQIWVLSD